MTSIACECLPPERIDVEVGRRSYDATAFLPFLDADLPDFADSMAVEISDIIRCRQIHTETHTATCFKRGTRECRFRFPRQLVAESSFDVETGVIHLQRDHCWLNGFNPWISLAMRANHDVQFLLTKDHAIATMYYIIKYISKDEQSLHSKLTIAAAARASQMNSSTANTSVGKQMITKVYNKIQSHREVGLPEAISHLLEFPDYYSSSDFVNVNTTQLRAYFKQHSAITSANGRAGILSSDLAVNEIAVDGGEDATIEAEIIPAGTHYKLLHVFDDYKYRGPDFAAYTLYEYVSLYFKSKKLDGIRFSAEHPQYLHCSQVPIRGAPTVPNLIGVFSSLNRRSLESSIRDEFFCILCALFVPWSPSLPTKVKEVTWEEHFVALEPLVSRRIKGYIENVDLLHKSKEESVIDRLQRPSLSDGAYVTEAAMDPDMNDYAGQSPDTQFEATAAAIRSFQNSIDLYTTEAIDASEEYGYLSSPCVDMDRDMDIEVAPAAFIRIRDKASLKMAISASAVARTISPEMQNTLAIPPNLRSTIEPSVSIADVVPSVITQSVLSEFSLNVEQTRAFRIVTDHALQPLHSVPQLLMGIFGEGGTGKSRLIDAIRAWFAIHGRGRELKVTAMTGSAASHIGGSTLHSATGIRVERKDRAAYSSTIPKLAAEWCDRRYLIIDEVSMVDRDIMIRLEKQLRLLTSNMAQPLGGMNILFCGDFLQFPCCSGLNVYIRGTDPEFTKGHDLWRSINSVVILRQQMRQLDDPIWAALLQRVRMRCPTDEDIALLRSRIGAPLRPPLHSELPPAIIVRRHTVRTAFNNRKLQETSDRTGIPITYCVADIVGPTHMHHQEIYEITYPRGDSLADAVLALISGVPLMLTKNIDLSLGILLTFPSISRQD